MAPVTINGRTRWVGVMGWPVAHTLSPRMQNAALAAAGIDAVYLPLPVDPDRLADAVRGLRALGAVGANVTIPHKVAVAALMDRLTPEATLIGAVNTVRVEADGSLTGHNTDCSGAVRAVEADGTPIAGRTVAILGAGGAGRGAAVGCALAGAARVVVLNRTADRASALVAELTGRPAMPPAVRWESGALDSAIDWAGIDVVMQMTSAGMHGEHDLDLGAAWDRLPAHAHVLEAVYHPLETGFLRAARGRGLRATDGLAMLVAQGAAAFEFWFGVAPDMAVMRAALASPA